MSYIKQLTDYHSAQGLVGRDLENAVQDDSNRVIANVAASGQDPKSFISDSDVLECLFVWNESEEGFNYWEARR